MHDYDVTLKQLFRNSSARLIRELTGADIVTWLDSEMPQVRNRRADLVGVTADGRIFHFELQTTNDPDLPVRMAGYAVDIRELWGRLPRQIVLYIGKNRARIEAQLSGPDFLCRYAVIDIRDLDGEELLASPNAADNIFAILAKLRDHKEAVRKILRRIAALDGKARQEAIAQLMILSGLRNLAEEVEREARKMPLLIDIMDNPVFRREYERGLDEGKAEGKIEGERDLVRRLLEKRFGSLPEWANSRLAAADLAELDALGLRLFDAATLEDLFR